MRPTTQKKVIIGLIASAVVIVPIMILGSLPGLQKTTVIIKTSPQDATITIDGNPGKQGEMKLKPGKYTIEAKRDHFETRTGTLDTSQLDTENTYYLLMAPADDIGRAYLAANNDEQMIRERASGNAFSTMQQAVSDKYPFITELPYETFDYKINYETQPDNTIILRVTLYPVAVTPGTQLYDEQVAQLTADAKEYLARKNIDITKVKTEFIVENDG